MASPTQFVVEAGSFPRRGQRLRARLLEGEAISPRVAFFARTQMPGKQRCFGAKRHSQVQEASSPQKGGGSL